MERQAPVAPSDEIELYVRTYTSLLRSTGEVRVRAFEEAHSYSASSLHEGALSPEPDISAFAYAAARLPKEMPRVREIVLGQSHETFEAAGIPVRQYPQARTRGRRRPLRWDEPSQTLCVFIASTSDTDDLIPIVTAYQIEWNKMHARLRGADLDALLGEHGTFPSAVGAALHLDSSSVQGLISALTEKGFEATVRSIAAARIDLRVRMLAGSWSQFQTAAQRWWSGIEPAYVRKEPPRRPPVYFVSSNTHAIANLAGGYAGAHAEEILTFARERNDEGLGEEIDRALAKVRGGERDGSALGLYSRSPALAVQALPLAYYFLRSFIHASPSPDRVRDVRAFEAASGLVHLAEPGQVEVDAQLLSLAHVDPARLDPRLRIPGMEALQKSDAVLLNIDYPLGMAAYHLLSRVGQGAPDLRGVYVMGKAATLNGRVGDVSVSEVVYDEHSRNTFLFHNAFTAADVRPYLRHGSVFDGQSALTVRSAFLQNKHYMNAFYRDGYTVLEMEAGPFLAAIHELHSPTRLPVGEILHLGSRTPFDVGILHYASDTPYSRRQSLLSKSLSYFGVDATYACAIAILRRIFRTEVDRVTRTPTRGY